MARQLTRHRRQALGIHDVPMRPGGGIPFTARDVAGFGLHPVQARVAWPATDGAPTMAVVVTDAAGGWDRIVLVMN